MNTPPTASPDMSTIEGAQSITDNLLTALESRLQLALRLPSPITGANSDDKQDNRAVIVINQHSFNARLQDLLDRVAIG